MPSPPGPGSEDLGPAVFDAVADTAQAAVGLCFGYAGAYKLRDFRAFENGVMSFQLVGSKLVRPLAMVVIALEMVIALSFLAKQSPLYGAAIAALLLTAFVVVIFSARLRNITAVCSCFGGEGGEASSPRTFIRIAFLIAGVVLVLLRASDGSSALSEPWWATVIVAGCIVSGCVALTTVPDALLYLRSDAMLRDRVSGTVGRA